MARLIERSFLLRRLKGLLRPGDKGVVETAVVLLPVSSCPRFIWTNGQIKYFIRKKKDMYKQYLSKCGISDDTLVKAWSSGNEHKEEDMPSHLG